MSSYDRPPGGAPRANTPYGFGIDSSRETPNPNSSSDASLARPL